MPEDATVPQQVNIRITEEAATPIQYANFARVIVTSLEAILVFALLDPATIQEDSQGMPRDVDARTVARIALPRSVMGALYSAMGQQLKNNPQLRIEMGEGDE